MKWMCLTQCPAQCALSQCTAIHSHWTCLLSFQATPFADFRQAQEAERRNALQLLIQTECKCVTKTLDAVRGAVVEEVTKHNEAVHPTESMQLLGITRNRWEEKVEYRYNEAWQSRGFRAEQLLVRSTGGEDGMPCTILAGCKPGVHHKVDMHVSCCCVAA
jgi:hypothetical protein